MFMTPPAPGKMRDWERPVLLLMRLMLLLEMVEVVAIEDAGNNGNVSDVEDVSSEDVAGVLDAAVWKALFIASNC
jgi:hypothetical protein